MECPQCNRHSRRVCRIFSSKRGGGGGLILRLHKIRFILKPFYANHIISRTVSTLSAAAFIRANMFCDIVN